MPSLCPPTSPGAEGVLGFSALPLDFQTIQEAVAGLSCPARERESDRERDTETETKEQSAAAAADEPSGDAVDTETTTDSHTRDRERQAETETETGRRTGVDVVRAIPKEHLEKGVLKVLTMAHKWGAKHTPTLDPPQGPWGLWRVAREGLSLCLSPSLFSPPPHPLSISLWVFLSVCGCGCAGALRFLPLSLPP